MGLPDVVEASHMSHPDFRAANGRIFATINEDHTRGVAMLTPEQQADLIARAPETFIPAAGAWGRNGSTMIVLKNADADIVGEAVTMAWQRISGLKATTKAAKNAKTKRVKAPKRSAKPRSRSRTGR